MELVLAGLTYDICLIYLDDILVFSRTFEEHCQRLTQVFDRLERQTLRLKASKCHLFQEKVAFLGRVVSERGIECDPQKTTTISGWPTPTSVSDVRTFCGLASYYRNFLEGFAKIAHPLHDLTRKNATFRWTEDCERAFQELKRRLVSAPPTDHGMYTLDTVASDFALGAVLQQEQDDGRVHVITYGSRSLSGPERRYCITSKEMLAVVFGFKKYRQHLLGRKVLVHTDHAALTYLKRTPEPIGQQARWLDFLAEFNYDIEHRAGHKHGNSNALSRRPCEREGMEPCSQCVKGTTTGVNARQRSTGCQGFEGELADPETSSSDATSSPFESDYDDEYESELSEHDRGGLGQPDPPRESTSVPVSCEIRPLPNVSQFAQVRMRASPDPV